MYAVTALAAVLAFTLPLTSAVPTPIPSGSNILAPVAISQYEVWTGAVHYNTAAGKIFKNGKTTDITTLVSFDLTNVPAGKTCEFHFVLDTTATVTGSGLFDVFTSLAPATKSTTSWPPGNLRDEYGGRLKAVVNGEATLAPGFPAFQSFPCPNGHIFGGELVGVYDVDDIEWTTASGSGPYIKWS